MRSHFFYMADVYLYISQKKNSNIVIFQKKKDIFFFYYRNISQLNSASALLLSKPSLLRSGWPSLLRSGWSSALLLLLQSPRMKDLSISQNFSGNIYLEKRNFVKSIYLALPNRIFLRRLASSSAGASSSAAAASSSPPSSPSSSAAGIPKMCKEERL